MGRSSSDVGIGECSCGGGCCWRRRRNRARPRSRRKLARPDGRPAPVVDVVLRSRASGVSKARLRLLLAPSHSSTAASVAAERRRARTRGLLLVVLILRRLILEMEVGVRAATAADASALTGHNRDRQATLEEAIREAILKRSAERVVLMLPEGQRDCGQGRVGVLRKPQRSLPGHIAALCGELTRAAARHGTADPARRAVAIAAKVSKVVIVCVVVGRIEGVAFGAA